MTNNTNPAALITAAQIRAMRNEAQAAGDVVQVHACDVALGEQDPVTTAADYEDRYGGGGLSASDRKEIMAISGVDDAMALCAAAIS